VVHEAAVGFSGGAEGCVPGEGWHGDDGGIDWDHGNVGEDFMETAGVSMREWGRSACGDGADDRFGEGEAAGLAAVEDEFDVFGAALDVVFEDEGSGGIDGEFEDEPAGGLEERDEEESGEEQAAQDFGEHGEMRRWAVVGDRLKG
jgi:hypothetical protein